MSTSLENFGNELKNKRGEKNISLRDMYEKTRIDSKYLEEIEKGNFDFMPDVYIRAFIRKYAESVELKPDEAIKMYDAAISGKNIDELSSEAENSEKNPQISDDKNNPPKEVKKDSNVSKNNIIAFAVIGIIIVIILFFFLPKSRSNEIIVEPKVEEILEHQNTDNPRFEVKNNSAEVEKTGIQQDSVFLKLNATDTVWFRIRIDGKTNDEFILHPTHSKTLTAASKINLVVGNSAGVEMFLNGKKLPFKGKKGEIRNLSIDLNGLHFSKKSSAEK